MKNKTLTELLNIKDHLLYLAGYSGTDIFDLISTAIKYFKDTDTRLGYRVNQHFVITEIIQARKLAVPRFLGMIR